MTPQSSIESYGKRDEQRFCGQWVSVKDELPTRNYSYLTLNILGKTVYKDFSHRKFNTIEEVTHWLRLYPQPPLPEVPKEDDETECLSAFDNCAKAYSYPDFKAGWHAAKEGK